MTIVSEQSSDEFSAGIQPRRKLASKLLARLGWTKLGWTPRRAAGAPPEVSVRFKRKTKARVAHYVQSDLNSQQ